MEIASFYGESVTFWKVRKATVDEFVGFLGTSGIFLLVIAFYLGGTSFVLFLLSKLVPAKAKD